VFHLDVLWDRLREWLGDTLFWMREGKPLLTVRFPLTMFLLCHREESRTNCTQERSNAILNAGVISTLGKLFWNVKDKVSQVLHDASLGIVTVLIRHSIEEVPTSAHVVASGELMVSKDNKGCNIRSK